MTGQVGFGLNATYDDKGPSEKGNEVGLFISHIGPMGHSYTLFIVEGFFFF